MPNTWFSKLKDHRSDAANINRQGNGVNLRCQAIGSYEARLTGGLAKEIGAARPIIEKCIQLALGIVRDRTPEPQLKRQRKRPCRAQKDWALGFRARSPLPLSPAL